MDNKDLVIRAGQGSGSSVTVDTDLSSTSTNPVQNKAIYEALGYMGDIIDDKLDKALEETISDAAATITPEVNHVYKCGTLTSLTITNPSLTGSYTIKFTSGSTATTTTIPSSIKFPEAFAAEANMRYEINVEDGYAVAVGWPTT